jgi:serine/threonine-protein kinase
MIDPSAPLVSPVSAPDASGEPPASRERLPSAPERSRKSRAMTEADASAGLDEERPSWAPGAMLAGKYTLLRPLGVGGMGVVWCARNESTGADVAIKMVLPRTLADKNELAARFRREAMATARLRHRSIVVVYDLLEVPEEGVCSLALVMELLEGETLAKLLERRSFIAPHEAVDIACALLGALAHAHEAGIVHRDIKPENVFLATDGDGLVTPKVLDFGISKLDLPKAGLITREGELLGTPSYMSPEQARSADVDGRSDLFNVGILLYEMLTGFNPFAGEGLHEVIVAILEHDPAPLAAHGVGMELAAVVARALAKDPNERYRSAREMLAALRASMGDTRQTSSPQLHVNTLQHLSTMPAPRMTVQAVDPMRGSLPSATIPPATVAAAAAEGRVTSARRKRTGIALLAGTAVLAACALGFSAPRKGTGTLATFGQNPAAASGDESTAAASHGAVAAPVQGASAPTAAPVPAAANVPGSLAAFVAPAAAADAGVAAADVAATHPHAETPSSAKTASSSAADAGARARGAHRSGFVRDPGF